MSAGTESEKLLRDMGIEKENFQVSKVKRAKKRPKRESGGEEDLSKTRGYSLYDDDVELIDAFWLRLNQIKGLKVPSKSAALRLMLLFFDEIESELADEVLKEAYKEMKELDRRRS